MSVKTLYYLRHSEKDHPKGNGQRTGEKGFELAKKLGQQLKSVGVQMTDLFAGELPRTWESVAGMVSGLLPSQDYQVHPYVNIGNDTLFGKFFHDEVKYRVDDGMTNWQAVNDANSEYAMKFFKKFAKAGVESMFKAMKGDTGVVLGHSPVAEAAAESFEYEVKEQPSSCEGFVFAMNEKNEITVTNVVVLPKEEAK